MAINRRDLIVRGGATAAALTAGGAAAPAHGADRHSDQVGPHRRRRGDRRRRHRHSRRDRGARGRLVGDPGRGAAACRRPCARLRRQCPARRRHQRAEEIRHRGLARPRVQGPHRLVDRAAQRRAGLPLQRPRDHPRLRRQQRRHLRWLVAHGVVFVDKPPDRRGGIVRRQLGAAHHARRAGGLAADPDRQAGDSGAAH